LWLVDVQVGSLASEQVAALAAAAPVATAPLHDRLIDFLTHAVAERRALVENMLAAQRSAAQGDVSAATLRALRRDERESRLRLMRSLLAMGGELAAAAKGEEIPALRSMWLTSVNSLLAIDQVSITLKCPSLLVVSCRSLECSICAASRALE
jgi:hypothetical protein